VNDTILISSVTTISMHPSFACKMLILFNLFIVIINLYYFIVYNETLTSTLKSVVLKIILSTVSNPNQCELSMSESDGWFCESDSDWKRRKNLHHIQDKRNHMSNLRSTFFQENWEPTINCEFERRLGDTGDGGK